jgi:undecaprenyl phosphate-alpha-L-ara4N flippase subunit ArnE
MTSFETWPPGIWLGLTGTPALISLGQVLFKLVGERMNAAPAASWFSAAADPYFAAAMAVYAGATLSWIYVLRTVPLGLAYTFTSLGFIIVPLLSALLFGEAITLRDALGVMMIVAGLSVIHG